MNQPASKEPTMDEILSSIRQIIADDDEAEARRRPEAGGGPARPSVPAEAARPALDPFSDDEDTAPLALSPQQIVEQGEGESAGKPAAPPPSAPSVARSRLVPPPPAMPDDVAFEQDEESRPAHEKPQPSRTSFAAAAPMPDPDLSADLATQLLEPATGAAVREAFTRLRAQRLSPETPVGGTGLTIEALLRDMLRPMLKDWLDENLPAMVERIVEQEIERVSRGGN